jgi:ribulose-bisphosphate carboxylase large chain
MMSDSGDCPSVSHERFSVLYRLAGTAEEACERARDICLEQTVEVPEALVPDGVIRDHVLGCIEEIEALPDGGHAARISYAVEIAGTDLTQLLNVVFGNISIKKGVRAERLDLPNSMLRGFKGPRYGRSGLRAHLGVPRRALLCTALKPLGLSAEELARLAYGFALGGIDIIKDDHGLADQKLASFCDRVRLCADAVARANRETGLRSFYAPNVTAPFDEIRARARFAKEHGAGGLLVAPGLTGLDAMRCLADDDGLALPILAHPAFQGTYVLHPSNGISHSLLFGQLPRLAGADATIFPNFGGRFSFTRDECLGIARGAEMAMGSLKAIFPTPGGGMTVKRVPELLDVYGRDVVLLIGGDLLSPASDMTNNCRRFRALVESTTG